MRVENGSYKKNENMSYSEYKSKMSVKKKQSIMMFVSIFLVLLLVFLGVAKIMSPDVDITLGDDGKKINSVEEDEYKGGIDRRLRELQMEDDMQGFAQDEAAQTEEDGLVKIPQREEKSPLETQQEEPVNTVVNQPDNLKGLPPLNTTGTNPNPISTGASPTALNKEQTAPMQQAQVQLSPKTYRVYVGMYSTKSQAEVARGILAEAGLGLTPTIKQAAGGFTLQVGAFSKKESADNLSHTLLINNYPARVVSD